MKRPVLQLLVLCLLFFLVQATSKEDHEIFSLRDAVELHDGGPGTTFYDFLGVSRHASTDEIGKALKKRSKTLHPDRARQSFVSNPRPRKSNEKKKPVVHKPKTQTEIKKFMKEATERYSRLSVVGDILKDPESRSRYDHFLSHGFPTWRGTGYYYSRYRPGLGTVSLGLFLVGGGIVHYYILVSNWSRQQAFLEKYIKSARVAAWGDEPSGLPDLSNPVDVPTPPQEESDSTANLNRRQKRELERQQKKDKSGKTKPVRQAPSAVPAGIEKRRIQAENGKTLIVDKLGNVYLEEEDEDGNVEESLLDLNDLPPKPTVWDTAVVQLPVYVYRRLADPFLKSTKPIPEVEMSQPVTEATPEPAQTIVIPTQKTIDMSSSQISEFEFVDSAGIDKEMEKEGAGLKKRGKKGKK